METLEAKFGDWEIVCLPQDGARIARLRYMSMDLLTTKPSLFTPPKKFLGEYETRPVYGYDDCFPTVDPCASPDGMTEYRDHGEVCWIPWSVNVEDQAIECSVETKKPAATLTRRLEFSGNSLLWKYKLVNHSSREINFLHVMHALMTPNNIREMTFPGFDRVIAEDEGVLAIIKDSINMNKYLKDIPVGHFKMLYLREVKKGLIFISFKNLMKLAIHYDPKLFPTLGIWWNNSGYPNESGLRRNECAFEPIAGSESNLLSTFNDQSCWSLQEKKSLEWKIKWEMNR